MGNKFANKSSFQDNQWKQIYYKDFRTILYNDSLMKSVEKHENLTDVEYTELQKILEWRSELPSQSCVTQLYEYGIQKQGLCNNYLQIFVIVQRISVISEIYSISKSQAFLIIRDVVTALTYLKGRFGLFSPSPSMIGINAEGRAKAWIHQNSSVFNVQTDKTLLSLSESHIINNIIGLVDRKVHQDPSFPIEYPRNLNFQQTINYINNTLQNIKGFKVDKIYLDRNQFAKNYKFKQQLKDKNGELNLAVIEETQKKLREITLMHQSLKFQQESLRQKAKQASQSKIKYQNPLSYNKEFHGKRFQFIQDQGVRQYQSKSNDNNEDNNHTKLVWTASTNKSDEQSHAVSTVIRENRENSMRKEIQNKIKRNKQRDSSQSQNFIHYNPIPPLPPLPPKKSHGNEDKLKRKKQIENYKSLGRQRANKESFRKQIEMIDSMIFIEEENIQEKNLHYIESRILQYPL